MAPDDGVRCLWRAAPGSPICGKTFHDPTVLYEHVVSVHIKTLAKGANGFRCGWEHCPRESDGKDGFPQRSKIERHMQTHIGREFFTPGVVQESLLKLI
jgi:hypothetical protein